MTMPETMDDKLIRRYRALFRGRPDVHGTEEGGCARSAPAWELHLSGKRPMGVYPLLDDATCWWAVVDVDDPEAPEQDRATAEAIRDALRALDLVGVMERSRSKGWHVWIFFSRPAPAHRVRRLLRSIAERCGKPRLEIFPKQDRLEPGQVGNYVRLPYPGGRVADGGHRAVWNGSGPLSIEEFLSEAGDWRNDPEDLDAALEAYGLPLDPPAERARRSLPVLNGADFLPCALKFLEVGAETGRIDVSLFTFAKHCHRIGKTEDEAMALLEHASQLCDWPYPEPWLRKKLASAYAGKAGDGYVSLGCEEPLWADGLCPGRNQCPVHEDKSALFGGGIRLADEDGLSPMPTSVLSETDDDNANRLAFHHGKDIRYVGAWKSWIVWGQTHWKEDESHLVMALARDTARRIHDEVSQVPDDRRKSRSKWAFQSRNNTRLQAMVSIARSNQDLNITPEHLDAEHWSLNFNNGTVDLHTGERRPHQREDLLTRFIPIDYDPDAPCGPWLEFLEQILPDPEVRSYVQRCVGYSLTGDVSEQSLFFLHGGGENGKSTFMLAIQESLGDYAQTAQAETILARASKGGEIRGDIAALKGARFVAIPDMPRGRRLNEGLVKQLTGSDRIRARRLYQDEFEFSPTHKLFIAMNSLPKVNDNTKGMWRRIKRIPFTAVIPEERKDPKLLFKLREFRAGIVAWGVAGCLAWQEHGLAEPEAVRAATQEYREDSDELGEFIADTCVLEPGARVTCKAIWDAYEAWCKERDETPIKRTDFAEALSTQPDVKKDKSNGVRLWRGIRILTSLEKIWREEESEMGDRNDG